MIPPGAGEHSRKVLEEAGLTAEEIDALISCQAVSSGDKVAHILPISYGKPQQGNEAAGFVPS